MNDKTSIHDKLPGEFSWAADLDAMLRPCSNLSYALYRKMRSHAWLQGGRLPSDHAIVRRIVGFSTSEWNRAWPEIQRWWRADADGLMTTDELAKGYADALKKKTNASIHGRKGAEARHRKRKFTMPEQVPEDVPEQVSEDVPEECPISTSPSSPSGVHTNSGAKVPAKAAWKGKRSGFILWQWMLEDIDMRLGPDKRERFDVWAFMEKMDAEIAEKGSAEPWRHVLYRLMDEAKLQRPSLTGRERPSVTPTADETRKRFEQEDAEHAERKKHSTKTDRPTPLSVSSERES